MITFKEYKKFDNEMERIAWALKELNSPKLNELANEMLSCSWDIGMMLIKKEGF